MRFVQNLAATNFDPDKIGAAVVLAGYRTAKPEVQAGKLMDHEAVRGLLLDAMQRAGITVDRLSKVHAEALDAVNPKNTALPDHNVRLRAVELGYDLLDAKPGKRVDVTGGVEHRVFNDRALQKAQEMTGEDVIDVEALEVEALERPL